MLTSPSSGRPDRFSKSAQAFGLDLRLGRCRDPSRRRAAQAAPRHRVGRDGASPLVPLRVAAERLQDAGGRCRGARGVGAVASPGRRAWVERLCAASFHEFRGSPYAPPPPLRPHLCILGCPSPRISSKRARALASGNACVDTKARTRAGEDGDPGSSEEAESQAAEFGQAGEELDDRASPPRHAERHKEECTRRKKEQVDPNLARIEVAME